MPRGRIRTCRIVAFHETGDNFAELARSCDETGVPDGACLARVRTVDSAPASHPPASSACQQRLFRSRAHGPQVDHRSPMTRASFGTACPSASSETPA